MRYLHVFQSERPVHINDSLAVARHQHRARSAPPHYRLWSAVAHALAKFVIPALAGLQVFLEEVPDLDATVVSNGREERGRIRGPLDVVYLVLERRVVADQLLILARRLLVVPNTNCPIVRACYEYLAV